ncbi:reticulocyte binding protein 2b, partial [Plasmodium gonderi]
KLSQEQKNSYESDLNDGNNSTEKKNKYHSKGVEKKIRVLYTGDVILGLSICYCIVFIAFNGNNEEIISHDSLEVIFERSGGFNGQYKEETIDVCFDVNYNSEEYINIITYTNKNIFHKSYYIRIL